jgi:hypothetical protein
MAASTASARDSATQPNGPEVNDLDLPTCPLTLVDGGELTLNLMCRRLGPGKDDRRRQHYVSWAGHIGYGIRPSARRRYWIEL